MKICLGCGEPLVKRHQYSFCSNACQRAADRRRRTAAWLETGIGEPAGSHRHYIRLHLFEDQGGLCAICGCQLPTYKSRNRGRGRAWRKQRYADGKSY